jgi:hypothetical protein
VRRRTVAVVGSPVVGNLDLEADILGPEEDPEAGNHDPGAGSLGPGVGRRVHSVHSIHRRVRDRQDRHRLERHENLIKSVLWSVLVVVESLTGRLLVVIIHELLHLLLEEIHDVGLLPVNCVVGL